MAVKALDGAPDLESLAAWRRGWFEKDGSDDEPLVDLVLGLAEFQEAGIDDGWLTPFKTSRAQSLKPSPQAR